MAIGAAILGMGLILVILWEGFETVILPRRVTRRFRLSRQYFRFTWTLWKAVVNALVPRKSQETWLSFYGPLALLLLLSLWASGLIVGFALLHRAASIPADTRGTGLLSDLYLSGTTFFTLGIGDVVPTTNAGRFLTIVESGLGFGFLGLVVSYLPPLNQSFGRREERISMLDARAGSPPTAAEMLRRHGGDGEKGALRELLQEWEHWSAELLESHLSYPILAYFRSQHDNQSWLSALTAVLDMCAIAISSLADGPCRRQAELTYAMARHAVVDLSLVFRRPPSEPPVDRLPPDKLPELRTALVQTGLQLREGDAWKGTLEELRRAYEPYMYPLATYFHFSIPPWVRTDAKRDNWQASGWESGATSLRGIGEQDHFH